MRICSENEDGVKCETWSPNLEYVTNTPSESPTILPSISPSLDPTVEPSLNPSSYPTIEPTMQPSSYPTMLTPTMEPTTNPFLNRSIYVAIQPSMRTTEGAIGKVGDEIGAPSPTISTDIETDNNKQFVLGLGLGIWIIIMLSTLCIVLLLSFILVYKKWQRRQEFDTRLKSVEKHNSTQMTDNPIADDPIADNSIANNPTTNHSIVNNRIAADNLIAGDPIAGNPIAGFQSFSHKPTYSDKPSDSYKPSHSYKYSMDNHDYVNHHQMRVKSETITAGAGDEEWSKSENGSMRHKPTLTVRSTSGYMDSGGEQSEHGNEWSNSGHWIKKDEMIHDDVSIIARPVTTRNPMENDQIININGSDYI